MTTKITILQETLAPALGIVSRAISSRSPLPILANILLAVDNGRLRLSASNLEITLTTWVNARIDGDGALTLPAKTLVDLVATLPKSGEIEISINEKLASAKVKCGANKADIKGIAADEFPQKPKNDKTGFTVSADDFKAAAAQVVIAASDEEARPILTGVLVSVFASTMALCSADGFRLSKRKLDISGLEKPASLVVPAKSVETLGRIIGSGNIMIIPNANRVVFQSGDIELAAQLIEGNYPDLDRIIPTTHTTRIKVPKEAFTKAVKQAKVFASLGNHRRIDLDFAPYNGLPGSVRVSAVSEEAGSTESVLEATIDGQPVKICLNAAYLLDFLGVVPTLDLIIETTSNISPVMLYGAGDESFMHLIMPLHPEN